MILAPYCSASLVVSDGVGPPEMTLKRDGRVGGRLCGDDGSRDGCGEDGR